MKGTALLARHHRIGLFVARLVPLLYVPFGFSMGTVMSYSLGLGPDRPAPAGILAFSGFIPVVEGWEPDFAGRQQLKVFVAHGRSDPIMNVEFARSARAQLEAGGLDVEYHESDAGHTIDPAHIAPAVAWLGATLQ